MGHLTSRPVKSPMSSTVREERCVPEHCPGGGVGKGHGQPCVEQVVKSFRQTTASYETPCCNLIGGFTSVAGWELALQISQFSVLLTLI